MHTLALGLVAAATLGNIGTSPTVPVAPGTPSPSGRNIPEDVNLDPRGEAGYIWSGYTPQNPGQPLAWKPREGDIVLMTSPDRGQTIGYGLAGVGHPFHSGIVVRRSTGELALLESGGARDMTVSLSPILGRLNRDDMLAEHRFYWVRRIKTTIPPDRSAAMTAYAEAQVGKSFVRYSRLAWFYIPGRPAPRPTTVDQERWFCSEIVAAILHEAGLVPPNSFKPGSLAPDDLFHDRPRHDLSNVYHAPLPWSMYFSTPPVPGPRGAPYRARE